MSPSLRQFGGTEFDVVDVWPCDLRQASAQHFGLAKISRHNLWEYSSIGSSGAECNCL